MPLFRVVETTLLTAEALIDASSVTEARKIAKTSDTIEWRTLPGTKTITVFPRERD